MPRTLVRAPDTTRTRSLGWLAIAWMEFFCRHGRGDVKGKPVVMGDEMAGFVVDCYALLPSGRMPYDSAFYSRPKGCDKSGLASRFCLFEALGPCRFSGVWAKGGEVYTDPWGLGFRYVYSPGEPMGKHIVDPFIRVLSTEEKQSGNVYDSIYFNLTDDRCPLSRIPGMDAALGRVTLPGGGEIRPSTASAASKDGGLEVFAVLDESHLYVTPELREMYATVTRNMVKRKGSAGTWYLETTTMFAAGQNSIAEKTYELAENIKKGRTRRQKLLYDHRWGVCADEDLSREDMLRAAILEAFGEAIDWQDVDSIVDEFYDPRKDVVDCRRYWLNAESGKSNSFLKTPEWEGCRRPDLSLRDGDFVTLGFDGSLGGPDADSTALVACRVDDGHLELIGCWEKPDDAGDDWQVDTDAVDDAVTAAMERFDVAGFYCDPPLWREYVNAWTRDWGDKMQVKASRVKPLEWWTNRPKPMSEALLQFRQAVRTRALSYTPAEDRIGREAELAATLKAHVLHAVRRDSKVGCLSIGKPYQKSPEKIDALMAAVLAWQARGDAVAAGAQPRNKAAFLEPRRLR